MDRRDFLLSTSLGAFAMAPWLHTAFAVSQDERAEETRKEWRRRRLRETARQARDQGKPLLVLIVPKSDRLVSTRAHEFSRWLVNAKPEHLLDVGLFALACATTSDLQEVFGQPVADVEPTMVWIDVGAFEEERTLPLPYWHIRADLEPLESFLTRRSQDRLAPGETEESFIAAQTEKLALSLRHACERRGPHLQVLANAVVNRLNDAERQALTAWIAVEGSATTALIYRCTAELRVALRKLESEALHNGRARLAYAIQKELERNRIPGSAWGTNSGCGFRLLEPENQEEERIGAFFCGMSVLPPNSLRFLHFFGDPEHGG